jgi:hypothetical protein
MGDDHLTDGALRAQVRQFIFESFRAWGTPPVVELVMTRFDLTRDQATQVFRDLEDAHHISLVPGTARILRPSPSRPSRLRSG